jgi:peptidoglycan/LPS O-acetylase OafA/YrhL
MEGISLGCLTALIMSGKSFSRRATLGLAVGGTTVLCASLIFSWQAYRDWLGTTGLNFTLLGVGTCMFIAATTQTEWKSPRVFAPLVRMGRYSYEIYLTHMFVVFTFFDLFIHAGKPMRGVPVLFAAVILVSGMLGAGIANLYSEPANRFLREVWGRPSEESVLVKEPGTTSVRS